MVIIPAIDVIDGKCVRLSKGDYDKKTVYSNDPVVIAKSFEDAGLTRLHIVDLDGAKAGTVVNLNVLENIASQTKLIIDYGGGVKTLESAKSVFSSGASILTLGSIAIKQPELLSEWIKIFGREKILIGADVLEGRIKISGWLEETGKNIFDFIGEMVSLNIINIFCTDIAKDGMMEGSSIDLYKQILEAFPSINFIASGGVSSIDDVKELAAIGCSGAIIGKAIYEGKLSLKQLSAINQNLSIAS